MNKRSMYGGNDYWAHEGKSGSVAGGGTNCAQRAELRVFKSCVLSGYSALPKVTCGNERNM